MLFRSLEHVSLVIFDEFHERSLHADLGLALTLETQQLLRNDLRILIMSATLEGERVATLLGQAPVIRSLGRSFPVEQRYAARRPEPRALEGAIVATVREALGESEGDVLVFLPGAREIRRISDLLSSAGNDTVARDVAIIPLHGSLAPTEQDRALRPDPRKRRKVVLATSVAETSLTIDGVRVVVDSGLSRVPRFRSEEHTSELQSPI